MADGVNDAVSAAKGALAHAEKTFPSSMAPKSSVPSPAAPKQAAAPAPKAPTLGDELRVKAQNVAEYTKNAPKMHKGGPVKADGVYNLRAGEHVLTEDEANQARKHALMAVGMKSLAKPGKSKMKK